MTILLQRAFQDYALGSYDITRTIPNGKQVYRIKATLSHQAGQPWPTDLVGEFWLRGPTLGVKSPLTGGQAVFKGGTQDFRAIQLDVIDPLPVGDYTLTISVSLPSNPSYLFNAALLIEYF